MKAAIIGLGVIGKVHYEVLRSEGEDIVALCDVDFDKLGEYEGIKKYYDYKTMLDVEKIDVVHVCTPHYLHAEMVIYALQKGVNVLCEKPLCINEKQIGEILEAEKKSKAILGVCFQNRYNNSSQFAKEYLQGKKIESASGTLKWHRDEAYYKSADWRGKLATEGGGVLINQAIHTLDLLCWIVGMPKAVVGETSNESLKGVIEVEDTTHATYFGEQSFELFATNTSPQDMPIELRFLAENEQIVITPESACVNGKSVDIDKAPKSLGKASYGGGHRALIHDFYNCVKNGKKFWIDGEEGAKALRAVLATYRSNGKRVEI
ncbi:MAG: Gfo/Idh/MocA family oxidoreductase [Clostridia bacterium]|nr:Gfo/Idh/MocA family oxidoreductase [Clostridia bacterium]